MSEQSRRDFSGSAGAFPLNVTHRVRLKGNAILCEQRRISLTCQIGEAATLR